MATRAKQESHRATSSRLPRIMERQLTEQLEKNEEGPVSGTWPSKRTLQRQVPRRLELTEPAAYATKCSSREGERRTRQRSRTCGGDWPLDDFLRKTTSPK